MWQDRFRQLYVCRTDCYGEYSDEKLTQDGKIKGQGRTVSAELTDERWDQHFNGEKRLGVIPIIDGDTCSWFGIDVDDYSIDLVDLARKVSLAELPLIVIRTKSGGAHLTAFFEQQMPAADARALGHKWANALGLNIDDVWPKQSKLAGDQKGSWIHMPYFNAAKTDCYAVDASGSPMSVETFIAIAEAIRIKPKEVQTYLKQKVKDTGPKESQFPPCIVTMKQDGIGGGGRNNALRHISVFWKKVYPDSDDWEAEVQKANANWFEEPLPMDEVMQIIKNARRSDIHYMCKTSPMCDICDKDACLTRKYGVGTDEDTPEYEIERISKVMTVPPSYIVYVNGQQVVVDARTLMSAPLFSVKVLEVLDFILPPFKAQVWHRKINELLKNVEIIDAPSDSSLSGQLIECMDELGAQYVRKNQDKTAVLSSLAYYDKDSKELWFKSDVLLQRLKDRYSRHETVQSVWAAAKDIGIKAEQVSINSIKTRVWKWYVPDGRLWVNALEKEEAF